MRSAAQPVEDSNFKRFSLSYGESYPAYQYGRLACTFCKSLLGRDSFSAAEAAKPIAVRRCFAHAKISIEVLRRQQRPISPAELLPEATCRSLWRYLPPGAKELLLRHSFTDARRQWMATLNEAAPRKALLMSPAEEAAKQARAQLGAVEQWVPRGAVSDSFMNSRPAWRRNRVAAASTGSIARLASELVHAMCNPTGVRCDRLDTASFAVAGVSAADGLEAAKRCFDVLAGGQGTSSASQWARGHELKTLVGTIHRFIVEAERESRRQQPQPQRKRATRVNEVAVQGGFSEGGAYDKSTEMWLLHARRRKCETAVLLPRAAPLAASLIEKMRLDGRLPSSPEALRAANPLGRSGALAWRTLFFYNPAGVWNCVLRAFASLVGRGPANLFGAHDPLLLPEGLMTQTLADALGSRLKDAAVGAFRLTYPFKGAHAADALVRCVGLGEGCFLYGCLARNGAGEPQPHCIGVNVDLRVVYRGPDALVIEEEEMSAPRLLLTRLDAEYGISFDDTCGVRQLEINPHHPAASSFPYANPAHLASLRAGMHVWGGKTKRRRGRARKPASTKPPPPSGGSASTEPLPAVPVPPP